MGNQHKSLSKSVRAMSKSSIDPMVISLIVNCYRIGKVVVRTRSSVDVMFCNCFLKLGLRTKDITLMPQAVLGLVEYTIHLKGIMTLPTKIGT